MTLIEHLIAKAVQQHTPVPGLAQGNRTLSTDAGGAVFCDLVVPGRVKMQLVQAIDVAVENEGDALKASAYPVPYIPSIREAVKDKPRPES